MRSPADTVYMHIPPWYREWFTNRNPNITLSDNEPLVVQFFNVCQGGFDAGMLWNEHFDRVLSILDIYRSMRDLAVYARIIDSELVIMLVSTDNLIIYTKSEKVRSKVVDHLKQYFPLTTKEGDALDYLNYRITPSSSFITFYQTPYILSFTTSYFNKIKHTSTDTPFFTDRQVEDDIANATPCSPSNLESLNNTYGEFQSNYRNILNCSVNSCLDVSYSMARLGHFITIPCHPGYLLLHKIMCHLKSHPNKPLIFPKQVTSSDRKIRIHWSANKSEDFTFDNGLESFQDASYGTEKLLRSSYGMDIQTFLGTAYAWKVHRLFLPTNSSNAELRVLYKTILRVKQYRLLLTSLGVLTSKPTKAYEDNESVVHTIQNQRITPRLRHIEIPICYLHHEHGNGLFETQSVPSRIQFANMGTKPES